MGKYEEIKEKIIDKQYEYISFDIFDTVIVRPFYNPSDLFYLLDAKFEKMVLAGTSFFKLRTDGETGIRSEMKKTHPMYQDVTLDEIYEFIGKTYQLPKEICDEIKAYEIELELKFAKARESVKELYNLALAYGKKIIFITDMYLPLEVIQNLLLKNGYHKFEKLFVSSEERKLKKSGDMYTLVLEELGISGENMLHIGDNYVSDIQMAENYGIKTCYIPKTSQVFLEQCKGPEKAGFFRLPLVGSSTVSDYREVKKSIGFGCMTALIANKYFDNPFKEFTEKSDFNLDPFFIGYYAVGMHLSGLIQWIENICIHKKYERIWFTSRDGWLLMHAYNIFRKTRKDLPEAKYLYVSREATLPIQIQSKIDFYNLPIEIKKYSPETLIELLRFCCKEITQDECRQTVEKFGIDYTTKFRNIVEYQNFINIYIDKFYSEEQHQKAKDVNYEYLKNISENDIIFDMGYSGRIHMSICRLLKKEIDLLVIYRDAINSFNASRKCNFNIYTFYDYTPSLPGLLREYFLSDYGPSCIGYIRNEEGELIPRFEKESESETILIKEIHKGALEFINDFYALFNDCLEYIPFKSYEVSLPFEGMLEDISDKDRMMFEKTYSGDEIYGKNPKLFIAGFWKNKMKEKAGEFSFKL